MTDAQTEARAIAQRLERAVKRAEEHAGMMPARQAVKLHPNDWHAVCDLAREAATALEAQAAELAAVKSKCQALDDECQQSMLDISRERDRAERAEAQLAEANKDLDQFMDRLGPRWFLEQNWFPPSVDARRVLEAQGGE